MTTAYTSLLGLALPVSGELSGVWGDTVNNSITSLLDSAIAGTTTLSSDADVTLTTTAGTANTSREAILLWTAGGTVTRNITAPAQSKTYIVINKSSSTQSIVLRGVGPTTGVTIVQGESAVCAWNGTDFIKVSNISGAGVFSSITNSGLTSGRVVYSTTGGLETDSANLTFNGTTLTAAGLAGPLNGTVGATTPAAASFTSLAYSTTLTGGTGIVNLGSGQFYKDASGNVGIGTTSPSQKLDVYGNANFGAFVSTGTGVSTGATGFEVGGNRTGNGDAYIDIHSTASTDYEARIMRSGGANGSLEILNTGTGNLILQTVGAGSLISLTNAAERMRIDSSGNVLVGTTSVSAKVTVQGSGDVMFARNTGSTGFAIVARTDFTSSNGNLIAFTTPGGIVGTITTDSTSTGYNTSSDYRLKNTIAPMTGALDKIALLKPVTYRWNADNSDGQGFIAHELAEVCPHAVTGEKDAVDADGKPQYQGIDTSFLVATLTAAIQEQQALITSLTARIAALEGTSA